MLLMVITPNLESSSHYPKYRIELKPIFSWKFPLTVSLLDLTAVTTGNPGRRSGHILYFAR